VIRRLPLLFLMLACAACDKLPSKLLAKFAALRPGAAATAIETAIVDAGLPPAQLDAGPPAPPSDGLQTVHAELTGPLEKVLADKVPAGVAPALALVTTRLTLWWMALPDARPGDVLDIAYELPAGHEPLVRALRYQSKKLGKTFSTYYYQAKDARFGRYFVADGTELEERLRDSPIESYEQVTSFLKDGRHHKGVDFKCPMETPIKMPFNGTLVKKNWNWHGNGNCLEFVDDATGRHAKFLHLSPLPESIKPGQHFKKGDQVALSGNTGHTTAPHLHYQLEDADGRILDPFKIHETFHEHLPETAKAAFASEQARLDQRLATPHY
jgi:murein DD-endopeptidase